MTNTVAYTRVYRTAESCYKPIKATEGSAAAVIEDVLEYQHKRRVVFLGDFYARVGKGTDVDDVIGSFGEDTEFFLE